MKILISKTFDLSDEQTEAVKKEAQRIESECGTKRTEFSVNGVSGFAVDGTMTVTHGPLKKQEPKAEAPKAPEPEKKKAAEKPAETVTNAPQAGKVTVKKAAKAKKK